MSTDVTSMDPKYIYHKDFVDAFNSKQIDFKIVGFQYDKLIFGTAKAIQKAFHYLQYLPILVIPFLAYRMGNWWILIGLLVYYFTMGFALRKIVPFIGLFTIYCIIFWIVKGFNIHQNTTIFFFCAWYTHVIINIDRNLQKEYAKQNVLLLKQAYNMLVERDSIVIIKLKC